MTYARDAWNAERASWRSVIQLNLVRSIITIVETLQAEMAGDRPSSDGPPRSARHSRVISPKGSSSFMTATPTGNIIPQKSTSDGVSSLLNGKHQLLQLRLGPLRRVEADLKRRFGEQAFEDEEVPSIPLGPLKLDVDPQELYKKEFGVGRLMDALKKSAHSQEFPRGGDRITPDNAVDEVTEVIASCKDDMIALWSDPAVRTVLKIWNVRLEDSAGFFLNDVERIASRNYEPSDDDVVRARLRTLGVQEYKIEFSQENVNQSIFSGAMGGVGYGREWRIYDVGGSRSMRHAWLPYFDHAQAIIFLAPVSCFDQHLSEDIKVNRLEDSFNLWRTICESKLLIKANTIIFLNKIDLLTLKLRSGVRIKHYLPSYGDRSNDTETMVRYLKSKFKDIWKQHLTEGRSCYFHATTVIDIRMTATTIHTVKDTILRDYLKKASLL
jgi:guanine nucleotide-binding protein subunit alpha